VPSVDVEVFEDNVLAEDPRFDGFVRVLHLVVDELSHRDANCCKSGPETGNNRKHRKLTNGVKLFQGVLFCFWSQKEYQYPRDNIESPGDEFVNLLVYTVRGGTLVKSLRKRAQRTDLPHSMTHSGK
jgi:hypothetical protein